LPASDYCAGLELLPVCQRITATRQKANDYLASQMTGWKRGNRKANDYLVLMGAESTKDRTESVLFIFMRRSVWRLAEKKLPNNSKIALLHAA